MPITNKEKIPQRGEYVPMQGGETPLEQAEIFQLSITDEDRFQPQFAELHGLLTELETDWSELDSGLLTQAWLKLTDLETTTLTTESAQVVRTAFGEVQAKDRNYLPLVSVYFALLHNSLEAQTREKNELMLTADMISQLEMLVQAKIRELAQQLRAKELELDQDKQARSDYQRGVMASYVAASNEGRQGWWQHTQIISQEDQERQQVKAEIDDWCRLEEQLAGYRLLLVKAVNQPLVTSLN